MDALKTEPPVFLMENDFSESRIFTKIIYYFNWQNLDVIFQGSFRNTLFSLVSCIIIQSGDLVFYFTEYLHLFLSYWSF